MSINDTTTLIVALRGDKDTEKNGRIIRFGNGANLDTIRGLAAEKLDIVVDYTCIQLYNGMGELLQGIEDARNQQVVYVDMDKPISESVPGPIKLPFVGNVYDLLPNLTDGWIRQFEKYGPLVELSILGQKVIGTNDPSIAELFAKESDYFTKKASATPLKEVKPFAGQGLFTSDTDDMDWKLAHKLLMPAFSPRAIKVYQEEMGALTKDLISILEQYKPDEKVEILDWATNITFETIGRIGFGYRFNLLTDRYQDSNPFIEAMGHCLKTAIGRVTELQVMKKLPLERNRRFDSSIKLMYDVVEGVIRERKQGPDAKDKEKDLLGYMLNACDEHNLGLSDENIRDQVITFLIAGHDTTANTLAWTLYELSRNPDIQKKLLQEIADNGINHTDLPTSEQISNLKYMQQVLKETLRKHPPLRSLGKYCKKECIVPGGYRIPADTTVEIHTYAMHRNPSVYPDPERYDPDRWTPEEEQKRSRFAWLPFSTGPRACIGMAFALQEAKTVLAMILHRFEFCYDGPDVEYDLLLPTTKPKDMFMTIHPRTDFPDPSEAGVKALKVKKQKAAIARTTTTMPTAVGSTPDHLPPITLLYGTQTGTAQDYASQLSNQARAFGFKKVTLCEMDKWEVLENGKFESEDTSKRVDKELVVVCTATYNGQPPDSADKFNKFIDAKKKESGHENILDGLSFAVFGIGNKNWRTYQHFPIKVNTLLEELGGNRFFTAGEGDADKDMDADFNDWTAHFWTYTLDAYGIAASESKPVVPSASVATTTQINNIKVHYIGPSNKKVWETAVLNHHGEPNSFVIVNKELQKEGSPKSTRHIEIDVSKLEPIGINGELYNAGDHLEVMPQNNASHVEAIALSFGWILDSVFEVDQASLGSISPRSLAANIKGPCTVRNMLTNYADITSPPSRAVLSCIAAQLRTASPDTASAFEKLIMPDSNNNDQYPDFIKAHRTLIDLLGSYPQIKRLDLSQFLAACTVIQSRRYSIASSPLSNPEVAHLTVGVVDDFINNKHYHGLASSFLRHAEPEDAPFPLCASFKSSKSSFNLPEDPSIPIVMISAGTGFSPFRGFLQERKSQQERGENVGKAILFFGCRHPDQDYIYQEEIEGYVADKILSHLHVAFSRVIPPSPIKYVQHQILANAAEVWNLLNPSDGSSKPAAVYICGSGAMSRDVRHTFSSMALSFGLANNQQEADDYVVSLMDEKRYNEDVWG
ncbi:cytochrome P450 [Backusella circina FSU 941]|nr:cytochrome P450 [Backusella circina FSU 941]